MAKPKYTPEKIVQMIDSYFASISYTTPAVDEKGRAITNERGEQLYSKQYTQPPTIADLCLYLDISKQTLNDWSSNNSRAKKTKNSDVCNNKDVIDAITRARLKIEAYNNSILYRERGSIDGAKFALAANFDWAKDKSVSIDDITITIRDASRKKDDKAE